MAGFVEKKNGSNASRVCFILISDEPMAYRSPFQFLKNESTDEYLAFRWQPTVDGRFPPGIRMNMTATIPQSPASTYTFDMTPSKSYSRSERQSSFEHHWACSSFPSGAKFPRECRVGKSNSNDNAIPVLIDTL